jgi:cardiolipin-specific phospholipase
LSPAQTEYKVLSFVPFVKRPPLEEEDASACKSKRRSESRPSEPASAGASPTGTPAEDPHGPRSWTTTLVPLSGTDRALHEFSITRHEPATNALVMLHGYGAGLGFFYKNFEPLSRLAGWKLYALDLLGMGRSSRPPFDVKGRGNVDEAEAWFIDALEEWRVKRKLDRFTLLGHSLGGYMAVAYALKYPGRLDKLVLVSPVGVPDNPYAADDDPPPPPPPAVGTGLARPGPGEADPPPPEALAPPPPRRLPGWATYLWESNVSPFALVRLSGPLGPTLVSGWTAHRFAHLPAAEAQALHDYSYSLFRQRGSGEYALAHVLAPGAYARRPLLRRIAEVGRRPLPGGGREAGVPVVLMYGSHDWMDVSGGHAAVRRMREAREQALEGATAEERRRDRGEARVVLIDRAGHHVYLDG